MCSIFQWFPGFNNIATTTVATNSSTTTTGIATATGTPTTTTTTTTTATALAIGDSRFGNNHSSKDAGYPGNVLATPRCMISATGADGFGHQFESKLSCMAVAEDIGLDYIHIRFVSMEHSQNGSSFDDYLGLSTLHASWQLHFLREMRQVAWVGKCKRKSWLRDVANGKTCKHDGRTVYMGDNCWDFLL
jgi:hypothetical protein